MKIFNMKLSLKLAACCTFTLILIIFGWSVGGTHLLKHQLIKEDSRNIYEEIKLISEEYMAGTFSNSLTNDNLNKHISIVSNYINSRILIVRRDGLIIYDTDNSINGNLFDYNTDIVTQSVINKTTIPGLIDEPFLSVSFPISYNMSVRGYIIAIKSHKILYKAADSMNIAYWPYVLSLSISAILIYLLLYLMVCIPLNRTIRAAREFSNRNFEYDYSIPAFDEFRELHDTLICMATDLNSLEEDQKKFISNISHDFRSPLTSIRGYAEAMIDGTIPPELHEKYINIILFETERLTKLTGNLLTLGTMDSQASRLDIAEFDINGIIKQISLSFEGTCTKKQIKIKLIFDEPETIVTADIGKIQQVLYNLTDNAIKFSKPSSTIQISTKVKNDKVFVSVKDNGIGIPKDSLSKIWERFYKTDLSRGKDKKGTGLGLSIVKDVINAHGENINVTSTVDVGTEFTFTLPLKPV